MDFENFFNERLASFVARGATASSLISNGAAAISRELTITTPEKR